MSLTASGGNFLAYDGGAGSLFTRLGDDLLVCSKSGVRLYSAGGTAYVEKTCTLKVFLLVHPMSSPPQSDRVHDTTAGSCKAPPAGRWARHRCGFNAISSCDRKEYTYRIYNSRIRNAFFVRYGHGLRRQCVPPRCISPGGPPPAPDTSPGSPIYWEGVRTAFFMVLRIMMLISCTFLLTYTTSPIRLTDALESLQDGLAREELA